MPPGEELPITAELDCTSPQCRPAAAPPASLEPSLGNHRPQQLTGKRFSYLF